MLHQVIRRAYYLNKHLEAPLLKEREEYLEYLAGKGLYRETLKITAEYLLRIIEFLHLEEEKMISMEDIEKAANAWAKSKHHHPMKARDGTLRRMAQYQLLIMDLLRFYTLRNPKFGDAQYAKKFEDEKLQGTLAALFSGLAIFISCLGLFGLAGYMAESRVKEVGVRKVLGASVAGITALLSKDFVKLVVISFLIAAPLAWWAMSKWLQTYTYRVDIHWWVFVFAGLLSVAIALLTVSYQSIRAAVANPIKNLRSE